jgi:hypothetical protein
MNKRTIWILIILLELVLGVLLGLGFIKTTMDSNSFFGNSYFSGIIRFYGLVSLIFILTVLTIGIIGAKSLNKMHSVKKAIYLTLVFWGVSVVIYTMSFSFFSYTLNWRILPIFILLIGIILGFNIGLASKPDKI